MHILVCSIENQLFGLDLENVERSILAMEVTPVPSAPKHILGAINVHGSVIPVVSVRALLDMETRNIDINDHFVVCHVEGKQIALWVDRVTVVRSCKPSELISAADIMPDMDAVRYALKDCTTIILIFDLEKLTSAHAVV